MWDDLLGGVIIWDGVGVFFEYNWDALLGGVIGFRV